MTVSTRSVTPPKYAAVTPTSIETIVAIALTTRVTISVSRVDHTSWENTSCPSWVVPSRCADDGGLFWA